MSNGTKKYVNSKAKYLTFTKKMVIIILGVSILWVTLSYILAFMGKDYIAESLSSTVIQVDIATILGYLCKAYFETKEEEIRRLAEKKLDIKKEYIDAAYGEPDPGVKRDSIDSIDIEI